MKSILGVWWIASDPLSSSCSVRVLSDLPLTSSNRPSSSNEKGNPTRLRCWSLGIPQMKLDMVSRLLDMPCGGFLRQSVRDDRFESERLDDRVEIASEISKCSRDSHCTHPSHPSKAY